MYIIDLWWTTQQVFIDSNVQNTTIILVLLGTDKTVFTEYVEDMVQ